MSPYNAIEYLCYLIIFILLYQLSEVSSMQSQSLTMSTTNTSDRTDPSLMRKSALEECHMSFSWLCLRIEFVKLIDRFAKLDELRIVPGISLVKNINGTVIKNAEIMAEIARSYPNDPSARMNSLIVAKLQNLLKTRFLRFKLIDDSTLDGARSVVSSRGKYKYGKKGGIEAIIAAGLMMKGTLLAMAMGAIALIAGKALLAALVALTLSAAVGVKGLAGGGGKSTTYEIIQKPVYTSSHSHSVSHEDGHAYNGHYASGHGTSGHGIYGRSLHLLDHIKTQ